MIIDSKDCPVGWLCEVLPIPWFGDIGIIHNATTGDIIPVFYDQAGELVGPFWS
jgi:hypothetical protein